MTFCQFEREILVERIKDKIAGAKRRGKFCGGVPILGYDVEDKRLMINSKEAKLIREIFTTYAKLGSGLEIARILNDKGCHTKSWTSKKGKFHPGSKFIPKDVYRILNNPLYIGMVQHNGNIYDGEQEAIIDKKLWDKVQYLLKTTANAPPGKAKIQLLRRLRGCWSADIAAGRSELPIPKRKTGVTCTISASKTTQKRIRNARCSGSRPEMSTGLSSGSYIRYSGLRPCWQNSITSFRNGKMNSGKNCWRGKLSSNLRCKAFGNRSRVAAISSGCGGNSPT
jgi:hypothetical protein